MVVDKDSRMNPDTSSGLYVTCAIRAQAEAVDKAKAKKKQIDESKRQETAQKNAQQAKKSDTQQSFCAKPELRHAPPATTTEPDPATAMRHAPQDCHGRLSIAVI
jgi:hypothetical protein